MKQNLATVSTDTDKEAGIMYMHMFTTESKMLITLEKQALLTVHLCHKAKLHDVHRMKQSKNRKMISVENVMSRWLPWKVKAKYVHHSGKVKGPGIHRTK